MTRPTRTSGQDNDLTDFPVPLLPKPELRAAADRGEPDDGSRYFEHWLAALEQLVAEKQLTDRTALRARKAAWADAYRRTPHGQPVELRAKCR